MGSRKTTLAKSLRHLPRLCYGCGTCSGICPEDAINMQLDLERGLYIPKINTKKCNNCDLCLQVCPWLSFDKKEMESYIFSKQSSNILGNFIQCYLGYSNESNMIKNSSSGGLITTLLVFALRKGIIDGAIVTLMEKNVPKPFIATTEEEIISAAGSKYVSVPLNSMIREILRTRGKFAVVGLPCHIQGIRKAERINKKLAEKIKIHLGLFCSGAMSVYSINILIKALGVDYGKISQLHYRSDGWPGGFKATLKDGTCTRNIPYNDYLSILRFYLPPSCIACWDATNEFSDLSFGDAWLGQLKTSYNKGMSLAISRTEKGETLLEKAERERAINLFKISSEQVIRSQAKNIFFKKKNLMLKRLLMRVLTDEGPNFENINSIDSFNPAPGVATLLLFFRSLMVMNKTCRKFIEPLLTSLLRRRIKNEHTFNRCC